MLKNCSPKILEGSTLPFFIEKENDLSISFFYFLLQRKKSKNKLHDQVTLCCVSDAKWRFGTVLFNAYIKTLKIRKRFYEKLNGIYCPTHSINNSVFVIGTFMGVIEEVQIVLPQHQKISNRLNMVDGSIYT